MQETKKKEQLTFWREDSNIVTQIEENKDISLHQEEEN